MNRLKNLSSKAKIVILLIFITVAIAGAALVAYAIQQSQAPTDSFATDNIGQRDITKRFSTNDKGDIALIGNVVVTCKSSSDCTKAQSRSGSDIDNNDFSGKMQYVDVDSDSATFDSSSATLNMPSDSTVLWAGLYWGGRTQKVDSSAGQVKFKVPGGTNYDTLTTVHTDGDSRFYGNFVDVTDKVKAAKNGVYTIANVKADPTWDVSGGVSAGWSLIVAYRDPAQTTMRNLTVFDGFKDYEKETKTFTLNGFITPSTGPIKASMGVVAWDGDIGIDGDSLTVNSTTLSNSNNPAKNIFNSTISAYNSTQGARTPGYANTLGLDIDLFDASNIIKPSSTSATFNVNITNSEFIALHAVTTVVDIFSPDLTITKSVNDVNGGSLAAGDTLEYTVKVENKGALDAKTVVLNDVVPANTTYVPGSLVVSDGINAGARTDTTGDDAAEISGSNIKFNTGRGATASAGGTLQPNDSVTIKFKVTVNSGLSSGTKITNTATYNATDEYGATYTGEASADINVSATPANISVTKTVSDVTSSGDGSTAAPSDVLEYALTVKNTGEETARNVSVTDTIPALTTYNASSLSIASASKTDASGDDQAEYTATGTKVTFRIGTGASSSAGGTLAANESVVIKFRVKIDSTAAHNSSITNKGTVSYNSGSTKDSNIVTTVVKSSVPSLDVTKSVSDVNGGEVRSGDILEYTFKITNNGQQTATKVTFTDTVPTNSTYANSTLAITSGANTGSKTDTTGDDAGEISSNVVKFFLGSGATGTSGGSLASGESTNVKFRVTVNTGLANNTNITNKATVTYTDGDNNNQSKDSNVVISVVKSTVPTLDLTKTAVDLNGGSLSAGDLIEYTITVNNLSGEDASNVIIRDTIDSNTTFAPGTLSIVQGTNSGSKTDVASDDTAEYDSTSKQVTFRLGTGSSSSLGGTLADGEVNIIKFRVTLNSGLGGGVHILNLATASYTDESDNDLESQSNQTDLITEVVNLPDTALDNQQTLIVLLGLGLIFAGAIALRFRLFDNFMEIAGINTFSQSHTRKSKKRSFEDRVKGE